MALNYIEPEGHRQKDRQEFIRACLGFDTFTDWLRKHLQLAGRFRKTTDAVWQLLREAWVRGAYPRGEATTVLNTSERTARNVLKSVLESGLLTSETERGPVRLGFPPEFVEDLFPRLYAPGQ